MIRGARKDRECWTLRICDKGYGFSLWAKGRGLRGLGAGNDIVQFLFVKDSTAVVQGGVE